MNIIFVESIELMNKVEKYVKKTYCNTFALKNCDVWALTEAKKIYGYMVIQILNKNTYQIKYLYISHSYRNCGYGKKMLIMLAKNALTNGITAINVEFDKSLRKFTSLLKNVGFEYQTQISLGNNQYMQYDVSEKSVYKSFLSVSNDSIKNSLVLNPTENFPFRDEFDAHLFEGLYINENKRSINDKIIFGGRNDFTEMYDLVKEIWLKKLNCVAVDIKTFSGLNAHLLFFLCTSNPGDKVVLLPEEAGGHYSTSEILTKIGLEVIPLIVDNKNCRVDIEKSKSVIRQVDPKFILIDRSEGLIYEDFSWLNEFKCTKIFDASQYITQILTGYYPNPFQTFDILISTLHKNYPGPQKCLICTINLDEVWQNYDLNSKTFVSNNHPLDIIRSVVPLLDEKKFKEYSDECIECANELYEQLIKKGLPIIERSESDFNTLHIWLKPNGQEAAYRSYLKLEELKILTNYRLLPYGLGYGLRIGVNAAVRQGIKYANIPELADIITEAYYSKEITKQLKRKASKFIKKITVK